MGKKLYSLLMFVVVSVIGGLLAAGLVVPMASLVASGGVAAADSLKSLPAELETPPQAERSRLLNADGSVLTYFYDENRIYRTLDKIAPIMRQAQVDIEDTRFYEHGAIDLYGTLRALARTSQGNTQGGSTITQQYVRLVQVEAANAKDDAVARTAATENSVARKVREMRYSVAVEQRMTKDEILEAYLNISYYGAGAYGVEAAARRYFGHSAAELTLPESAMLAGMVRNPNLTNPLKHPEEALERRNNVLDRMAEIGTITTAEATAAKATKIDTSKGREVKLGCQNANFPFLCDYALRTLLKTPSLGSTVAERKERIMSGGLTIRTMIDPSAQRKAEKTISSFISGKDPVVAVIVMLEPGTGQIIAMAQNRQKMGLNQKKGETYFNYAAPYNMGGTGGFQGGSTFKAFVAAAALEQGLGAYTRYNAKYHMNFKGETFKSCRGNFPSPDWSVTNASPSGRMDLFSGAKYSVNTFFAQLERDAGICASVKMAKRLGLEPGLSSVDLVKEYSNYPSFTLGAVEIAPISLVEAYATFAARGVHCDPVILKSITTKDGTERAVPSANCKQIITPEVADAINKIFQGPYHGGTATYAYVPGLQMAGKTGTVPDNKAIWTMGYTSTLAAGAMISYDNDPYYDKYWDKHRGSYLRGAYLKHSKVWLRGASGSEAGGRLLRPAFTKAIADRAKGSFVEPPASILRGQQVDIPSCYGMSAATCQSVLNRAGFRTYVDKEHSSYPKGTVLRTSPSGTTAKFGSVAIVISSGPKVVKPEEPDPTDPTEPGTGGGGRGRNP